MCGGFFAAEHNFVIFLGLGGVVGLVASSDAEVGNCKRLLVGPAWVSKVFFGRKEFDRGSSIVKLVNCGGHSVEAFAVAFPKRAGVTVRIEDAHPWEGITAASVPPTRLIVVPYVGTVLELS